MSDDGKRDEKVSIESESDAVDKTNGKGEQSAKDKQESESSVKKVDATKANEVGDIANAKSQAQLTAEALLELDTSLLFNNVKNDQTVKTLNASQTVNTGASTVKSVTDLGVDESPDNPSSNTQPSVASHTGSNPEPPQSGKSSESQDSNFYNHNSIRDEYLKPIKRIAMSIMIGGFILIAATAIIILITMLINSAEISENIFILGITFITGIFIECIGAYFMFKYINTMSELARYHSQLVGDNNGLLVHKIVNEIKNKKIRDKTLSDIAKKITLENNSFLRRRNAKLKGKATSSAHRGESDQANQEPQSDKLAVPAPEDK